VPTGLRGRLRASTLIPVALASVRLLVLAGLLESPRGEPIGPEEGMLLCRPKACAEELPGVRARASELSAAAASEHPVDA
jgi:hypothetical protein